MKKVCCLLMSVFLVLTSSQPLSAATISSAIRLDVNQQIRGHAATYTLDIPLSWRRHVVVYRDSFLNHPAIVERLVFFYDPASVTLSRAELLTLSIFDREHWNENSGYTRLVDTYNHVFAIRIPQSNPFVFGSDRLIFDTLLRDASNAAFLRDYISVPIGADTVIRNTVSVNGKRMPAPSSTNSFRVVLVPLRATAEALGYTVGWDAAAGSVSVSSGTFHTTLGGSTNSGQRHNIVNIDGLSYISTMFFLQVLGCNVEIDEHSNVRISREERR